MTGLTIDRIIEVEDRTEIHVGPLLFTDESFTRSNGTVFARIYERLTKASRRRQTIERFGITLADETFYRKGVYDTMTAIRDEIA